VLGACDTYQTVRESQEDSTGNTKTKQ